MAEGIAVVTGASRGIGAAIACDLAARGFDVVGLSRSGASPAGRGVACDVTDEAALADAVAAIGAGGPIAVLVNNAGVHLADASATLPLARYDAVMRLNATAVMLACREAHPYLKAHGAAHVINIGSFFDKLGVAENLAYCASKAAVGAITRCLAVEWAADGISVVDVAPGYVETDLNRDFLARPKVAAWLARRAPAGRPGSPDEVARIVGAIVTAAVPFLTGETIYLDGGQGINV